MNDQTKDDTIKDFVNEYYVSQWNSYAIPEKDTIRELAVWSNEHDCLIDMYGVVIPFESTSSFIKYVTGRRLLIFTHRVLEMKHLSDLLSDKRVNATASRTQGIIGLYIKSRFSSWIVEKRIWEEGGKPDSSFLEVMNEVFRVNNRCASTPGSLGERKIRETLPKRGYSRPSNMLRKTLLDNKIGGRSDTHSINQEYSTLYENDINSAYPYCASETIDATEHSKRFFGDKGDKFFSYFAKVKFYLPLTSEKVKFGPLPIRIDDNHLKFPTDRGIVREGWYWKEEIERARKAGYIVDVIEGYGWTRSSDWLKQWAINMYKMRNETDGRVRNIIKKEMVASIGRMGMSPEKLSVVSREKYQKGDIPIVIQAEDNESSISDYFIHIEPDLDNCSLTHISSYILMRCRVALYDRVIQEEELGNEVVATNYDSYYSLQETKLAVGSELGQWKTKAISHAIILGPRSIKGIKDGHLLLKMPGVKREKTNKKASND